MEMSNNGAPVKEIIRRTRLSMEQVRDLEKLYEQDRNPDRKRRAEIASDLGLSQKKMDAWFQYRRSKRKASEIARAEADQVQYKMMKLERAVINREKAEAWNQGFWAGMKQAAAMEAATPAAAMVAPVHPLRANMFNGGGRGYEVQTTNFPAARPHQQQQHGFR